MKIIRTILKSFDIFGKRLYLNFDQHWDTHPTKFGGISTAVLIVFVMIYTGILVSIMVNYEQNTSSSLVKELDLSQLGQVQFDQTDVMFFAWISGKMVDINQPIEQISQYADIYFEEQYFDLSVGIVTTVKRVPIKWCTQEDFGQSQTDIKFFKTWVVQGIICADFTNQTFNLKNDGLYVKYTTININFDKCNRTLNSNCKSDQEIQQFFSDFSVQLWTYNQYMDFDQYSKTPIKKQEYFKAQIYPAAFYDSNTTQVFYFMMRKNFIQTQDDRFQYGQYTFQGSFFDISEQQLYMDYRQNYNYLSDHLVQIQIYIGSQSISYSRKSYSITDIARDIGGITNVLLVIFSSLISPFSNYSFILRAIKRLYQVNTVDNNLFQKTFKRKSNFFRAIFTRQKSREVVDDILNQKSINLSNYDNFCLFFSQSFGKFFICRKFWPKYKKMIKFYKIGNQKINDEMNIIYIIKIVREIKILLTHFRKNQEINNEILADRQGIIDLDEAKSSKSESQNSNIINKQFWQKRSMSASSQIPKITQNDIFRKIINPNVRNTFKSKMNEKDRSQNFSQQIQKQNIRENKLKQSILPQIRQTNKIKRYWLEDRQNRNIELMVESRIQQRQDISQNKDREKDVDSQKRRKRQNTTQSFSNQSLIDNHQIIDPSYNQFSAK